VVSRHVDVRRALLEHLQDRILDLLALHLEKDIAEILGGKNRASEILSGKRGLTLSMIRDSACRFIQNCGLMPKGKLYASFPVRAVSWYFPELFPPSDVIQYGDELEIDRQKMAPA
jgi:hypothetical protein